MHISYSNDNDISGSQGYRKHVRVSCKVYYNNIGLNLKLNFKFSLNSNFMFACNLNANYNFLKLVLVLECTCIVKSSMRTYRLVHSRHEDRKNKHSANRWRQIGGNALDVVKELTARKRIDNRYPKNADY